MRKRPIQPAESLSRKREWGVASIGHPNGLGSSNIPRRGEYIGVGEDNANKSNTVGSGWNKWVSKKKFVPWDPSQVKVKAVSGTSLKQVIHKKADAESNDD